MEVILIDICYGAILLYLLYECSLNTELFQGDLYNHESLVKAIREVDVVISAVGYAQLADQTNIIAAIEEAGNIKVLIS